MNSKGIVPIPIEKAQHICMKCLCSDKPIRVIEIEELGYGSGFDGAGTEIHLCEDCYHQSNPKIWTLNVVRDGYCEEYEHESEIFAFIESLPLESRELIYNEFEHGWGTACHMDRQDWIDYQLDELPHDVCKEYGLYSPDEIKAYKERFPTCEYPYERVYRDGSRSCWCALHHAIGEIGQLCGTNISEECYQCDDYKLRTSPIKTVTAPDIYDYEIFVKSNAYQERLAEKFCSGNCDEKLAAIDKAKQVIAVHN